MRFVFYIVAAFTLVVVGGCGGSPAEEEREETTEDIMFRAQSNVNPAMDSALAAYDQTDADHIIQVELVDYDIKMPLELPAGLIDLRAYNAGEHEHSLAVEGEGRAASLEGTIPPNDTQWLRVALQPGSYVVYCPVENHAERGMLRRLIVHADTSDTDTVGTSSGAPSRRE